MRKGGVPEGYALIPVKLNFDLEDAFFDAWEAKKERLLATGTGYAEVQLLKVAWKALLAAAPQPPALDRNGIIEACADKVEGHSVNLDSTVTPLSEGVTWQARHSIANNVALQMREKLAAAIRAMKGG